MCVAHAGDIALVTLIFKPLPPTLKMITGLPVELLKQLVTTLFAVFNNI